MQDTKLFGFKSDEIGAVKNLLKSQLEIAKIFLIQDRDQALTDLARNNVNAELVLSCKLMATDLQLSDFDKFPDLAVTKLWAHYTLQKSRRSLLPIPVAKLDLTEREILDLEEWSIRLRAMTKSQQPELPKVKNPPFNWFENGDHASVLNWLKKQSPSTWHDVAEGFNWDYHADKVLPWIVSQRQCDLATALTLFILGEWYFWSKTWDIEQPESYDNTMAKFMKTIWNGLLENKFATTGLKVDDNVFGFLVNKDLSPKIFEVKGQQWSLSKQQRDNIAPKS